MRASRQMIYQTTDFLGNTTYYNLTYVHTLDKCNARTSKLILT